MFRYYAIQFVLPPGIFVALLVLAGLWLLVRRHALAGFVNLSIAALLWALSSMPVATVLTRGLESPYYRPAEPRGDAIVLLGGGVHDGASDPSGRGAPNDETMGRIVTAVRLQKRLGLPVIVSGGAVFANGTPEAPIVKRILVDLGVPPGKIVLDDRSRDTLENARYSCRACTARGLRAPIVVTSAYHMRRAILSFEKAGMKATPFPSGFRTWPGRAFVRVEYLPGATALLQSAAALREYIGYAAYCVAF